MLFEFIDERDTTPSTLYNVDEGFIKGNMYKNLYDKYKHYEPKKFTPKTELDLITYNLYKYCFAINDLNLYLDIHPDDTKMYELFKKYVAEYKATKKKYESIVGPLTITHDNYNKYSWINVKMPWEDFYV